MTPIIDTIRKLRELSNSSNANEAASAAAAADKLIAKHRISEAEIEAANKAIGYHAEHDSNVLYESARIIAWKSELAITLANNYGCHIVISKKLTDRSVKRATSCYHLVGSKGDAEIVRYMFAWLSTEIERLCKATCVGLGHVACQSYCEGATVGIRTQLDKSKVEIKKAAIEAGSTSALAVLDNRLEVAKLAMQKLFPKLKYTQKYSKCQIDINAFNYGKIDGMSIHLGKALKE
jgi:hypothetical protein